MTFALLRVGISGLFMIFQASNFSSRYYLSTCTNSVIRCMHSLGHVVEFCLDQNGSRFIQQRLEVADAMEKKAVVDELVPSIQELQNDVFGNYVIQKLFEFGNDDVKRDLKSTLKGNMRSLSLQMYG